MRHRILSRGRKVTRASLLASAIALTPSLAEAHGGLPRAFSILSEPGNPDHILLRSDVWGMFRSTDGGKNWFNGCAELYRSSSTAADHVSMTIAPGGRLLVAANFRGLYTTDDFCSWRKASGFSKALPDGGSFDELVLDVQNRGNGLMAMTATNINSKVVTKLWTSPDKGDTWTTTIDNFPSDFSAKSLGIPPPGAPQRIYVAGRYAGADAGSGYGVMRSDDDGTTWRASKVPSQFSDANMRIALIHPTDPDIYFLWADQYEDLGMDSPDELYSTTDGGKTFNLLYASKGDLPGIALSPDNKELLIAGPLEGILAAKLDDALANGQKAFQARSVCDPQPCAFWGLAWTSEGLYAGTDDYKGLKPLSTFGVSHDGGKSFSKLMGVCDVKLQTSCGAMSTMATTCVPIWEAGYARDYTNTDRCMPGAGGAAGSGGGGASGSSGAAGSGSGGAAGSVTGAGAASASTGRGGSSGGASPTSPSGSDGGASSRDGGTGDRPGAARKASGEGCDCTVSSSAGRPSEGMLSLALLALGLRRRRR
jgi:MYXO-CTERM domain-containing protein